MFISGQYTCEAEDRVVKHFDLNVQGLSPVWVSHLSLLSQPWHAIICWLNDHHLSLYSQYQCSWQWPYMVISRPTHISDSFATLIDHIYTNSLTRLRSSGVISNPIADHLGIYIKLSYTDPDLSSVVHGGVSQWSAWSTCSGAGCGAGQRIKTRACNNPLPSANGKQCKKALLISEDCSVPCLSKLQNLSYKLNLNFLN